MDVRAHALYVAFEYRARKNVGREVAIRALRAAEGNGKIQAEWHLF
jgi:hypothetical protein